MYWQRRSLVRSGKTKARVLPEISASLQKFRDQERCWWAGGEPKAEWYSEAMARVRVLEGASNELDLAILMSQVGHGNMSRNRKLDARELLPCTSLQAAAVLCKQTSHTINRTDAYLTEGKYETPESDQFKEYGEVFEQGVQAIKGLRGAIIAGSLEPWTDGTMDGMRDDMGLIKSRVNELCERVLGSIKHLHDKHCCWLGFDSNIKGVGPISDKALDKLELADAQSSAEQIALDVGELVMPDEHLVSAAIGPVAASDQVVEAVAGVDYEVREPMAPVPTPTPLVPATVPVPELKPIVIPEIVNVPEPARLTDIAPYEIQLSLNDPAVVPVVPKSKRKRRQPRGWCVLDPNSPDVSPVGVTK